MLSRENLLRQMIWQVALADLIIMNKVDLVSSEQKDVLTQSIRSINGSSRLIETTRCSVSLDEILDLQAYSGTKEERISSILEEVKNQGTSSHLDKDVGTVTLELELELSRKALDLFLTRLLWEKSAKDKLGNSSQVIRFKALCSIEGEQDPVLVQAVYDMYDCTSVVNSEPTSTPKCRLIFIGTHLDRDCLHTFLSESVKDSAADAN